MAREIKVAYNRSQNLQRRPQEIQKVYFDHAATSFPKPPEVVSAMVAYMERVGSNVGRGGYASAYEAAGTVLAARERPNPVML